MLQLRLVDPREEPRLVAEVLARQSVAYAEFSAKHAVMPIRAEEVELGSVNLIVACDEYTGEIVGGLRLYLRPAGTQLPVERLLHQYPRLAAQIESLSHRGIAEIAGCWVNRGWRGTGLSVAMFRMAIAAMPLLGVTRGLAFSHHHVLPNWAPLGWSVDSEIARINYPDARYETSVIWIDPVTLSKAQPPQQASILALRQMLQSGDLVLWSPHSDAHEAIQAVVAS